MLWFSDVNPPHPLYIRMYLFPDIPNKRFTLLFFLQFDHVCAWTIRLFVCSINILKQLITTIHDSIFSDMAVEGWGLLRCRNENLCWCGKGSECTCSWWEKGEEKDCVYCESEWEADKMTWYARGWNIDKKRDSNTVFVCKNIATGQPWFILVGRNRRIG